MPLLFRILYGCGLRISEALALQKGDVDLNHGTLHIRHGKNHRERIVPMSATLIEECRKYIQAVHKNTADSIPFFYTKEWAPYSKSTIEKFFRSILWDIGIPYRGTQFGPRVHDLRHPNVKPKTQIFFCNIRNYRLPNGDILPLQYIKNYP